MAYYCFFVYKFLVNDVRKQLFHAFFPIHLSVGKLFGNMFILTSLHNFKIVQTLFCAYIACTHQNIKMHDTFICGWTSFRGNFRGQILKSRQLKCHRALFIQCTAVYFIYIISTVMADTEWPVLLSTNLF